MYFKKTAKKKNKKNTYDHSQMYDLFLERYN